MVLITQQKLHLKHKCSKNVRSQKILLLLLVQYCVKTWTGSFVIKICLANQELHSILNLLFQTYIHLYSYFRLHHFFILSHVVYLWTNFIQEGNFVHIQTHGTLCNIYTIESITESMHCNVYFYPQFCKHMLYYNTLSPKIRTGSSDVWSFFKETPYKMVLYALKPTHTYSIHTAWASKK